jgi:hypothetical protein
VPAGSADRDRSEVVTVQTPRGAVDVLHQEGRGLGKRSGWHKVWLARRVGKPGWAQGITPREAIRRAMLLPAGETPGWLKVAAAEAERKLDLLSPFPGVSRENPTPLTPTGDGHVSDESRWSTLALPAAGARGWRISGVGRSMRSALPLRHRGYRAGDCWA